MKKTVLCMILCFSLLLSAGQIATVRAQDATETLTSPEYPYEINQEPDEDLSPIVFGKELHEDWHHHPHFEKPIEREFIPPTPESLRLTQEQVQSFDCATVTDVPQTECEALVALYESTNGAGWRDNTNWLSTTTVGNWQGVTVVNGHINEIYFYFNRLSGNIPIELGRLSALTRLSLLNDQLSGSIPKELGQLSALESLNLEENQLSGSIPPELGQLSALKYLYLSVNQLSGNIPPQLGQLSSLQELVFFENKLSGSIPAELGQLSALSHLRLDGNKLSGSIPPQLGQLNALKFLELEYNQLSGSIPPQLGQLSALRYLLLWGNQLSGSIPPELGQLSNLDWLSLDSNQLSGSIPPELGQLSNLDWLSLDSNQLSGSIPPELGQLSNLYRLDLSDNLLSGSIPPELGQLRALENLNLSNNQLNSHIPQELGQLTNLLHLDLSHNSLEGDVPASITNLVNLCVEGDVDYPCDTWTKTDLGYNLLNVPQPNPPSDFLFQKDPDWDQTQGIKQVISGFVGGMLKSNDGNTTIIIPRGAVDGEATFILKPMLKPIGIPAPILPVGNNFELTAWDANGLITTFNLPLGVTLRYADAQHGAIPEDSLKLHYYNETASAWQDAITTCSDGDYFYNPDQNWFSLPVCHLSDFAVVGEGKFLHFPLILK